jgi:hypothetical protein
VQLESSSELRSVYDVDGAVLLVFPDDGVRCAQLVELFGSSHPIAVGSSGTDFDSLKEIEPWVERMKRSGDRVFAGSRWSVQDDALVHVMAPNDRSSWSACS